MSAEKMLCVDCNRRRHYPDGFPSRARATCWECLWWDHMRSSHKSVIRRIRRDVRKRARRITARDEEAAMLEIEKRALIGGDLKAREATP